MCDNKVQKILVFKKKTIVLQIQITFPNDNYNNLNNFKKLIPPY